MRDRAVELLDDWLERLDAAVRDAQAEGAIDPAEDADQLAFELDAYLLMANLRYVAQQGSAPMEQARRAIASRLAAAAPAAG